MHTSKEAVTLHSPVIGRADIYCVRVAEHRIE